MRYLRLLFVAALLISAMSCQAMKPTYSGLWLSEGYGMFASIDDQSIRISEVTATSCTKDTLLMKKLSTDTTGSLRFLVAGKDSEFVIKAENATTLRFQETSKASDIVFKRISKRPEACQRRNVDSPSANLEVFAQTFLEHYPYFEMKSDDLNAAPWSALTEEARKEVNEKTSPEKLFKILTEMIAPLQDAHTGIAAPSLSLSFNGLRADPAFGDDRSFSASQALLKRRIGQAFQVIGSQYTQGELESFCQGHLLYGKLANDIAYLRLDEEGDFSAEPGFAVQLETMNAALDLIFEASRNAKGLVLDLRLNYGGSDLLSLALASRLTPEKYFAFTKVARADREHPEVLTKPQDRYVIPSSGPGFHGPVAVLTGPYTISAGETLTQALMERALPTIRIGENTQGVFSDTLLRHLPNGWQFWLPNELFLTSAGNYFDGKGIPPDIRAPVFQVDDIAEGRDPALEIAIKQLTNGSF